MCIRFGMVSMETDVEELLGLVLKVLYSYFRNFRPRYRLNSKFYFFFMLFLDWNGFR